MKTQEYQAYLDKEIKQIPERSNLKAVGEWAAAVIMRDYIMKTLCQKSSTSDREIRESKKG